MRAVPRHEFVPAALADQSYEDHAVPLADGQTVSQPYIVALMTQMAEIPAGGKVLEIGTGSGYQAAVLAEIAGEVYTVEVREGIHEAAQERLARLHYRNVHCRCGDGRAGWPEAGPFDAILVTAAPSAEVPPALIDPLADGARLVAPLGAGEQVLIVLQRRGDRIARQQGAAVRFVPMVEGESLAP